MRCIIGIQTIKNGFQVFNTQPYGHFWWEKGTKKYNLSPAHPRHSQPSLEGLHNACAGRALEWHSRGQRFDPAYLHQDRPQSQGFVVCFM